MKVLTRAEFLAIKHRVVYSRIQGKSISPDDLELKLYTDGEDWVFTSLTDFDCDDIGERIEVIDGKTSAPFDPTMGTMRDGTHAATERYLVWDRADVSGLIELLTGLL